MKFAVVRNADSQKQYTGISFDFVPYLSRMYEIGAWYDLALASGETAGLLSVTFIRG